MLQKVEVAGRRAGLRVGVPVSGRDRPADGSSGRDQLRIPQLIAPRSTFGTIRAQLQDMDAGPVAAPGHVQLPEPTTVPGKLSNPSPGQIGARSCGNLFRFGQAPRARPMVVRMPNTSCRRPVAPSTGMRSRPAAPPRSRARAGGPANGTAMSASSAAGPPPDRRHHHGHDRRGEEGDVQPRVCGVPESHGEGRACRRRRRWGCRAGCSPPAARVASGADRAPHHRAQRVIVPPRRTSCPRWRRGRRTRTRTPRRARGSRRAAAAGVPPRGDHARRSDGSRPPHLVAPARGRRHAATPKARHRRSLHRSRRRGSPRPRGERTDPGVVGSLTPSE